MSKWYGKVISTADSQAGIIHTRTFKTKEAAEGFADGFNIAKQEAENSLSSGDFNQLEDCYAVFDQITPTGEA